MTTHSDKCHRWHPDCADERITTLTAERDAAQARAVPIWECPDCAFEMHAQHEDVAGGYTCPVCEVARRNDPDLKVCPTCDHRWGQHDHIGCCVIGCGCKPATPDPEETAT